MLPILPMWAKISAALVALSVLFVGKFYFKLSNSSPIEQIAEQVIKEESGIDINVGPDEK